MGRDLSAGLLGATPLVDDAEVQSYVNHIGLWLAMQTERPDLPWTFGVIDTDTVNALAAPGGYVFVTRGLFLLLRNEAELAGVIGTDVTSPLALLLQDLSPPLRIAHGAASLLAIGSRYGHLHVAGPSVASIA